MRGGLRLRSCASKAARQRKKEGVCVRGSNGCGVEDTRLLWLSPSRCAADADQGLQPMMSPDARSASRAHSKHLLSLARLAIKRMITSGNSRRSVEREITGAAAVAAYFVRWLLLLSQPQSRDPSDHSCFLSRSRCQDIAGRLRGKVRIFNPEILCLRSRKLISLWDFARERVIKRSDGSQSASSRLPAPSFDSLSVCVYF